MLDPGDTLKGLAAIVGGGGVSGIIIAIASYLTEARRGRKPSDGSLVIGIGDGYNQSKWHEVSATALTTIAANLTKIGAIMELEAKERLGRDISDQLELAFLRGMKRDIDGHHGEK